MTNPPTATLPSRPSLLPTRAEATIAVIFPAILVFGSAYALRAGSDESYFTLKSDVVNTVFAKRGWGWASGALLALAATAPGRAGLARLALRWAGLTGWWVVVTQWCFGPPLIDRSLFWSGGRCDITPLHATTQAACRAAGGAWAGGHDISGHVFLLVLCAGMLTREVGGLRPWARGGPDATSFVWAVRAAVVVVLLSLWMLLVTAIYFHTWVEKVSGLLLALLPLYAVYVLPRSVPALDAVIGSAPLL